MKKTTFQYMALSAMFIGTFGLASCDKNDEPTPSPVETKQHFVCFNTVDQKIDYLGTFADLSQKTVDKKRLLNLHSEPTLLPKGIQCLSPMGTEVIKFINSHVMPTAIS